MVEIEKSVPIPEERFEVPISKLEVGESIKFPEESRANVASNASRLKAKTGKVFTIRKVDEENARVWRKK